MGNVSFSHATAVDVEEYSEDEVFRAIGLAAGLKKNPPNPPSPKTEPPPWMAPPIAA